MPAKRSAHEITMRRLLSACTSTVGCLLGPPRCCLPLVRAAAAGPSFAPLDAGSASAGSLLAGSACCSAAGGTGLLRVSSRRPGAAEASSYSMGSPLVLSATPCSRLASSSRTAGASSAHLHFYIFLFYICCLLAKFLLLLQIQLHCQLLCIFAKCPCSESNYCITERGFKSRYLPFFMMLFMTITD